MLISLQMLSRPDGPAHDQSVWRFADPQITIGRAPECQLALPDELRVISRHHARIAQQADAWWLACLSNSAPVRVNGEGVKQGASAQLHHGDVVHVGGFEMRVAFESDIDVELGVDLELPSAVRPGPAPAAVPVPTPRPTPAPAPEPEPARRARLDEWFDLEPAVAPMQGNACTATTDGAASAATTNSRIVVSWRKEPLDEPAPKLAAPNFAQSPAATPLRCEGGEAATSDDPRPELDDAARLELMRAFAEGARLDASPGGTANPPTSLARLTPEWMRRIGELLAASVDGTLALLHSRATVKREMRAEMTVISRRQNNPLKFAPDVSAALAHLIADRRSPGFLEPVAAVKDAHDDLLAHQLAVVAGMRAALFELVARTGPEAVTREQGAPGPLAQLFPQLHEAALWRRHRQRHADLTTRLDSDFEAVFGREFTKAYEAQVRHARQPGEPEESE